VDINQGRGLQLSADIEDSHMTLTPVNPDGQQESSSVSSQFVSSMLNPTSDADKTILDSYGETTILKRRRENDDDQEGPSAGSDWRSKRRRE
nr:hypothetical protein [Tanacetum cinerariifolium]